MGDAWDYWTGRGIFFRALTAAHRAGLLADPLLTAEVSRFVRRNALYAAVGAKGDDPLTLAANNLAALLAHLAINPDGPASGSHGFASAPHNPSSGGMDGPASGVGDGPASGPHGPSGLFSSDVPAWLPDGPASGVQDGPASGPYMPASGLDGPASETAAGGSSPGDGGKRRGVVA
ncbi:hypothetical protein T484DRAFT_1963057 [Baffinella frigidus]|nr:hypothetical protein T484DRAFT_1963057 [Cryptophyta sp. CCMP2293]